MTIDKVPADNDRSRRHLFTKSLEYTRTEETHRQSPFVHDVDTSARITTRLFLLPVEQSFRHFTTATHHRLDIVAEILAAVGVIT